MPRNGGTLHITLSSEPTSLNPLVANDPVSQRAYAPLFPLLYSMGPDFAVAPDFASALPSFSDDGKTLTVPVRADAKWSDGVAITADDVVYTISTEMNGSLQTKAAFNWGPLDKVSKVDDHTVRFTLSHPDAAFIAESLVMPIVPAHTLSAVDPSQMAGNAFGNGPTVTGGPFKFDKRAQGQTISLTANASYYGGRPHADALIEHIVADENTAVTQLGEAQLSVDQELSGMGAANALVSSGVTVNSFAEPAIVGVQFNLHGGRPFADTSVRQALATTLDHDGIVSAATGTGQGFSIWGDINPMSWAYDPSSMHRYANNPQQSQQMLHGAHPTGALIYPMSDGQRAMAAAQIAQQSQAAGFKITPVAKADKDFASALSGGDFDAALVKLDTGLDPDNSAIFGSNGAENAGGYSSSDVDSLLNMELSATPGSASLNDTRKPIFNKLEQTISGDLPIYFLWAPRHFIGLSAIVGGVSGAGAQLDRDRANHFYVDWYLTA
ncbi:MAG: ABC transporter substrate-binding protein [Candidatus Dormibacteria bacterium]